MEGNLLDVRKGIYQKRKSTVSTVLSMDRIVYAPLPQILSEDRASRRSLRLNEIIKVED